MGVAVILGSSFRSPTLGGVALEPVERSASAGLALFRWPRGRGRAFVLFRHGVPHHYLPHQIPYREQARALASLGCRALMVTSSVGVPDPELPLYRPLLVSDLLMPDNRLPDGSACTVFTTPQAGPGHLVLDEGLFSVALGAQVADELGWPIAARVVFSYVGGPRTKSLAENRYWRQVGAQVNSMTLAPKVVLANDLGIAVVGLVVGHKRSDGEPDGEATRVGEASATGDEESLQQSFARAGQGLEQLVVGFLETVRSPAFGNQFFRFGS